MLTSCTNIHELVTWLHNELRMLNDTGMEISICCFWKFYFCLHRLIGQQLIYRTLYNKKFCQFIWRILLVELYFHYLKIIIFNIDVWTRWRWRGACEELDLFSIVILHYSVIDIERNLWSFLFILQSWRKINMKR